VVSTLGCHIMGSEDEAEQSIKRARVGSDLPRRHTQSDELTSPIVPGGDLDAGAASCAAMVDDQAAGSALQRNSVPSIHIR
jgi:hypothetical protein